MTQAAPTPKPEKDVPLGPACMVVFMFMAVAFSLFVVYVSVMMMGNQGKKAAYPVRESLIPWVERSSLSDADRASIISQLTSLANDMDREELTRRQLSRLAIRLNDCTVLQWGTVEALDQRVQKSTGLNDKEKLEFSNACDRWLRCASEGKLSMTEVEFSLQNVCLKDPRTGRLDLKPEISDEALREVFRRILSVCEKYEISKEPFEKSVSQVFRMLIEDGLKEKY